MPSIEATAFKRHVEAGELYPVYFLHGAEKYLLARASARLTKKAKGESFPEFNYNELSSEATVDEIADAALALPFMAGQKCVLVSDFNVEGKSAGELSKLNELLQELSESTVLVFSTPTLLIDFKKSAKWRSFVKQINEKGASVEFNPLDTSDLVKFLCAEAEKCGSRISKQNAAKVAEYAGNDLTNLKNEISKLSSYAMDREITMVDIEELVTKNLETTVFILSKAIIAGDYSKAYSLLNLLFYAGERAVPILSVLSTAFVDMYRVRAALQSGKTSQSPAGYGDYKGREFRLKNAERDVRSVSTEVLRSYLDLLVETDLLLKGSRISERIVMEELIAKLLLITKGERQR